MMPPVIAVPPSSRMPRPPDGAVMGDPAVIGREFVRGVLGGHAALEGEALRPARRPGRAGRSRGRTAASPPAIRIWLLTRSMPVTISVTVCSTWMRGLTSMK